MPEGLDNHQTATNFASTVRVGETGGNSETTESLMTSNATSFHLSPLQPQKLSMTWEKGPVISMVFPVVYLHSLV